MTALMAAARRLAAGPPAGWPLAARQGWPTNGRPPYCWAIRYVLALPANLGNQLSWPVIRPKLRVLDSTLTEAPAANNVILATHAIGLAATGGRLAIALVPGQAA
jgi:hypothetical protein